MVETESHGRKSTAHKERGEVKVRRLLQFSFCCCDKVADYGNSSKRICLGLWFSGLQVHQTSRDVNEFAGWSSKLRARI